MANTQIVQSFISYVQGLDVDVATATTLTVGAGQCRDSSNAYDIAIASQLTINCATNGALGLDSGSLANNTWYAVLAIGSSTLDNDGSVMVSTSATAPTMPSGYDVFRRIGWVRTDGSAQLRECHISGNGHDRLTMWDPVLTALTNGTATTFTDIDLSGVMPSTSTVAYLNYKFTPASAGNLAEFRANGSSATTVMGVTGGANLNAGQLMVNTDSSQVIEYKVANGADDLDMTIVGYVDNL